MATFRLGDGRSAAYGLAMWAVRLGVRMAKYLPWHPDKLGAWTRGRELPKVPSHSFRDWWQERQKGKP